MFNADVVDIAPRVVESYLSTFTISHILLIESTLGSFNLFYARITFFFGFIWGAFGKSYFALT
jgi:hypothetical protein